MLQDAAQYPDDTQGQESQDDFMPIPLGWVVRETVLHSALSSCRSQGRSPARVANGIWQKHYGGRIPKGCGLPVFGTQLTLKQV